MKIGILADPVFHLLNMILVYQKLKYGAINPRDIPYVANLNATGRCTSKRLTSWMET
jgi:hypothetical protein